MTNEQWLPVPGFPGYEVSDAGRVRSHKQRTARILRPGDNGSGHLQVGLRREGKSHMRQVHCLVALAFIGPVKEGLEVCHNDGNPGNNTLSNLRYDTRRNNLLDRAKHGYVHPNRGERHPRARVPDSAVSAMRAEYAKGGITLQALADKYGMSKPGIHHIISGKVRAA